MGSSCLGLDPRNSRSAVTGLPDVKLSPAVPRNPNTQDSQHEGCSLQGVGFGIFEVPQQSSVHPAVAYTMGSFLELKRFVALKMEVKELE